MLVLNVEIKKDFLGLRKEVGVDPPMVLFGCVNLVGVLVDE